MIHTEFYKVYMWVNLYYHTEKQFELRRRLLQCWRFDTCVHYKDLTFNSGNYLTEVKGTLGGYEGFM